MRYGLIDKKGGQDMTLINIKNVKKDYYLGKTLVPALRGVNLDIGKGEFLSIVGPSGSGKTTLLNIVGCLDTPSEGVVEFEGQDVTKFNDKTATLFRRHNIGFIFQTFNLVPVLTAFENVEIPLLMTDLSKEKRKKIVEEWIARVGIADYMHHKPEELSGGQRQRVSIVRALVDNPKLVLADEPTANLDHETGLAIIDIMKKMNKEVGTTFVFSTHDPKVMQEASRVVTLADGKIGGKIGVESH